MPTLKPSLQRLWQPRNPLFWLVVVFNLMSSAMAWGLHLARPEGVLLLMLTVLALANTGMGWWLLWRLWKQAPPPADGDGQTQTLGER
jgi:hypothetical protein